MYPPAIHNFHIPVMGLAYTIDTPIKVARFGISSVISIMGDRLIEMMRQYYYPTINQEYHPISVREPDYRARRITDYLDLVNKIVQKQTESLRMAAFEAGSEIVKYFEMLPEYHNLKQVYRQMLNTQDLQERMKLQDYLRKQIRAGSIDVNIMTKPDRETYNKQGELMEDCSDAVSALRGYTNSTLTNSSVIFSAGMNPRLFNYLGRCNQFDVNGDGGFSRKIIIKVSDYRSALIQGKYLAKKGIWVSEFRIESGLNCGGHAFATEGYLLGPILEEFKTHKQELTDTLFEIYNAAFFKKCGKKFIYPPEIRFSVQGGVGTHEENEFLRLKYNMQSIGWGTPFLLVPEATTVDDDTLKMLCAAKKGDVVLSRNSPLGERFHYLKGTSSDKEKSFRIKKGRPGSPCTEKHLAYNTEFTSEPICTASFKYQKLKIQQLESLGLPDNEHNKQLKSVLDKECLCIGLSNSATIKYNQVFVKTLKAVTICPGPNIINFSRIVSLQTITDHIYGRVNILANQDRPHMFITELQLYIDYLKEQLEEESESEISSKRKKYYSAFYKNLMNGIHYYRDLQGRIGAEKSFAESLADAWNQLDLLDKQYAITVE